ncbi:MAG: CBS domain-containing protein [Flavobacteriaceae bacterium]|jgi:CBS domain-containing protein|nr:CBS domain-containing protein [Flavobacteriaceae bacterium]
MKKRTPVSTIMTKSPVTVNLSDGLAKVNSLFKKLNIRHIPVVSGKKLIGIISQTDIMRLSFGDIYSGQEEADNSLFDMLSIEQVMVASPKTVKPDDTIRDVAEIFASSTFRALPVVEDNDVVGIVTTTDVIKYLLEQYD